MSNPASWPNTLAERKVGCDRSVPACQNCQRSHRHCQGYGIKLAWPDKADGRRKQRPIMDIQFVQSHGTRYVRLPDGMPFLNTTYQDLRFQKLDMKTILSVLGTSQALPYQLPSLLPGQYRDSHEALLLSYCMLHSSTRTTMF
jgi:hypothetical protein